MGKLVYMPTGGASLAVNPKLLGDAVGVAAVNQDPSRGDLRPWRNALGVATIPGGRRTIYRLGRKLVSDSQYWLSWPGIVHAIHGFISQDTTERTYYTGDGAPKVTNNILALAGANPPAAFRDLGVPVPPSLLILNSRNNGTATETEIRYYTYTYVTDWGDESAPAPPAQIICKTDDIVDIQNIEPPPSGSHGINRVRIYRTSTGVAGDTEYLFLREHASSVGQSTDDGRSLGEVMPTNGWLPPPATLTWLTSMWNGMAAAINSVDGSVRYCVPYKPYAWPIAYETLPPDAEAVALATFGQRLLVLTNGRPVLVTGSSSDSLDEQPLQFHQACIAPLSVVGFGHGVVWACPDGLAYYGDNGVSLLTAGLMTKEDWKAINPATLVGGRHQGAYVGFYEQDGVRKGFIIDPLAPSLYQLDVGYGSTFYDESAAALFVLDGVTIRKWNAGPNVMTARARSKVFVSTDTSYSAGRVEADAYPLTFALDYLNLRPEVVRAMVAKFPGLLSAPNTETLRFQTVVNSRKPFRLPGGFVAREHQLQITADKPVQWAAIANSMNELVER